MANTTNIESRIVHAVWSSVETLNSQVLLPLSDSDLVCQIIQQVDQTSALSSEDRQSLINYVDSKIMLIKDIVNS